MNKTNTSMMRSKVIRKRPYGTRISMDYLGCLLYISKMYCKDPYPALRIAYAELIDGLLRCKECEIIVNLIMYLLFKYAYPKDSEYGKFTIHYSMETTSGIITYALGQAITFRVGGVNQPVRDIVDEYVREKAEAYGDAVLTDIFIRIYYDQNLSSVEMNISNDQIARLIAESVVSDEVYDRIAVRKIENRKPKYLKHITRLKPNCKERRSFIVADTETILVESDTDQIEKVHMPYAVGFVVVKPGSAPSKEQVGSIETYFSEEYPVFLYDTFRKRSYKMLTEFIDRLAHVVRKDPSIHTIYFHNLSRFDGYLFLKFFASGASKYTFKPLIKDHQIYELVIYNGKKLLLRLRDSLKLLPGRLDDLALNLCPQLGRKGFIPHNNVNESNLFHQRDELLEYMKQDILLLGGVMHRAQEIYYSLFQIDIVKKRTLSSLALDIFRTLYYDQKKWPIYIPNRNEDTFIRRGYYGGHSDTYIPYGKELYYYDVNSLYPHVMKNFPMPGGEPVWMDKCEDMDLDSLFGFIEAYVVAPPGMKRPFLPYRSSKKSLIFPTGEFVGVYYSEELKYAKSIGYQVTPLCGYIFQKITPCTPFGDFVTTLSENRIKAKNDGNDSLAFVYKILMNSLYGRFGINPGTTVTEVCDYQRYTELIRTAGFIDAEMFTREFYIVTYKTNTERGPDTEWNPPKISAVQLAAAITACARIHMHPYISRDDCHYTDTDSVLLNGLLPDSDISSTELGKFKLEYASYEGICLAAKSYTLFKEGHDAVIKHKGVAKSLVTPEWYKKQYENLNRTTEAVVKTLFYVNWKTLDVGERSINVHLGSPTNTKREAVYDNNNAWVDTKPFHVIDYAGQEIRVLEWKLHSLQKEYELFRATINKYKDGKSQNSDGKSQNSDGKSQNSDGKSQNSDGKSQNSDDSNKYTIQTSSDPMRSSIQTLEPRQAPTLYIHPPKKSKRKKKRKKKKKPG